jgi:hypothetical protein
MGVVIAGRLRAVVIALAVVAVLVTAAGSALAISGGGYRPPKQGCSWTADDHSKEHSRQSPGCHDLQMLVRDGFGHTYLQAGTNTTEEGQNVHAADIMISPDGTATPTGRITGTGVGVRIDTRYQPIPPDQCGLFDLATYPIGVLTGGDHCDLNPAAWRLPTELPKITPTISLGKLGLAAPSLTDIRLYFGADDGLDSGEHDEPDGKHGTRHSQIGPSDGGSVVVHWHPLALTHWLASLVNGSSSADLARLAHNPLPIADAGFGACADGICIAATSKQRDAYRGGGGAGPSRNVYDYDGKAWDPYNCSGQSTPSEKQCHDKTHRNEDAYRQVEAKHVRLQPGLQLFEDPDPNGSPLLPTYPLPAVYVGSCGLTIGGGPVTLPKSPLTNQSGQLSLSPAHC